MSVPGSAATLSAALEGFGADAGGESLELVAPLLIAVTTPMLYLLSDSGPRPAATREALGAWCSAALRAGALPALRRLMAAPRRGGGAPPFRVHAASLVSVLVLIAAEPAAASAGARGAGDEGAPEGPAGALPERRPDDVARWRGDPAVPTAVGILIGCLTGAPA
jgi:hypothetical protein